MCCMLTLTGVGFFGFFGIDLGGLGDMLLFRAVFLLVPVEFVCEPYVCCSWESTISHSEGDRFVDQILCFSFFGAPLVVALFGGGRIEVVSGKTNFRNCSFICNFML